MGSNSIFRAVSMKRLGLGVEILDIAQLIPKNIWWQRLHKATGYLALQNKVAEKIKEFTGNSQYDLVWVDSGYLVGPKPFAVLRSLSSRIVNYTTDDPTGKRDGNRWYSYRKVMTAYDTMVAVRKQTCDELRASGAKNVIRELMSYDEHEHRAIDHPEAELAKWRTEAIFVGSWMPERGPFLQQLLDRGVPLTIYGDNWHRARNANGIKAAWRGMSIYGEDYNRAIRASKICLGLLSKGNRDQHTQRTFEIPAIGGLLLAQRTAEHSSLYQDGVNAVLWGDSAECADKCLELLKDTDRLEKIRRAGTARVKELKVSNGEMITRVLNIVFSNS
jgi:spore maturation protein CgeB